MPGTSKHRRHFPAGVIVLFCGGSFTLWISDITFVPQNTMHPHSLLRLGLLPLALAATDPRIQVELTLDTPCNGVSTTPDSRLFVLYARVDGTQAQGLPEVVEWINGTGVPYPNAEWNSYAGAASDPVTTLVRVNSQRVGPDGNLWLVDTGSPGFGSPVILPQGPKLVVVDVQTNEVARVYSMGNVTKSSSLLDDIRFNLATGKAYLTDAGVGALIVLDLATGSAIRVLEGDQATGAFTPVSAEGRLLNSATGQPQYITADQLEVSPDGAYFYWQPASGGMFRIETAYLDPTSRTSSSPVWATGPKWPTASRRARRFWTTT